MKKKTKSKGKAPAKRVDPKPYKIDSGIKVTDPVARPGLGISKTVVTMNLLKAGDSFLIRDPFEGVRAEKQMRDVMVRERKTGGKRKFVSRRLKNGVRIWRTA